MSPTLSLRTLAPIEYSHAPYIKFSIAIQATSDMRTLTKASTENTPKMTYVLEEVLKKKIISLRNYLFCLNIMG